MKVEMLKQTVYKGNVAYVGDTIKDNDTTTLLRWCNIGIAKEVVEHGDIYNICDNDTASGISGNDSASVTVDKLKNVDEGKRTNVPNNTRKNKHKQ